MSAVNFANFDPARHSVYEIGDGVIPEMADAFDHRLTAEPDADNLGELIGAVGPAKALRGNIAGASERLGLAQARNWVQRSGLLAPVERSFMSPETERPDDFSAIVATGGVRNWMQRRAEVVAGILRSPLPLDAGIGHLEGNHLRPEVLLAAGNRVMQLSEGPDVERGMTEADYMADVVAPELSAQLRQQGFGVDISVMRVNSDQGSQVMAAAAEWLAERDPGHMTVAVAANAGNWVQNAGQLRRAARRQDPSFDDDTGRQLWVVSDTIELGVTGQEPAASHQNPLSALGIIARNAREWVLHQG